MGLDVQALALAKKYTRETIAGAGAIKGDKGDKGDTGAAGADGKSAYEVAVDEGFDGTEAEWLASLKGEKGDKGDTGSATDENAVHKSGNNVMEEGSFITFPEGIYGGIQFAGGSQSIIGTANNYVDGDDIDFDGWVPMPSWVRDYVAVHGGGVDYTKWTYYKLSGGEYTTGTGEGAVWNTIRGNNLSYVSSSTAAQVAAAQEWLNAFFSDDNIGKQYALIVNYGYYMTVLNGIVGTPNHGLAIGNLDDGYSAKGKAFVVEISTLGTKQIQFYGEALGSDSSPSYGDISNEYMQVGNKIPGLAAIVYG